MTTVPPSPNLEIKSHHCISVYSETSARVLLGSVADTHLPKSNHVETVPFGVGDREAWRAAIHGVAKSRTRLSD